jgi:hypothetical protein
MASSMLDTLGLAPRIKSCILEHLSRLGAMQGDARAALEEGEALEGPEAKAAALAASDR